mmetsp:Transcript_9482/g.28879  ORF Transcript_9482/g.28879 Transcript_9482/m.28879 type:complete len:294 (+) Transcript_9482:3107-3988(+)
MHEEGDKPQDDTSANSDTAPRDTRPGTSEREGDGEGDARRLELEGESTLARGGPGAALPLPAASGGADWGPGLKARDSSPGNRMIISDRLRRDREPTTADTSVAPIGARRPNTESDRAVPLCGVVIATSLVLWSRFSAPAASASGRIPTRLVEREEPEPPPPPPPAPSPRSAGLSHGRRPREQVVIGRPLAVFSNRSLKSSTELAAPSVRLWWRPADSCCASVIIPPTPSPPRAAAPPPAALSDGCAVNSTKLSTNEVAGSSPRMIRSRTRSSVCSGRARSCNIASNAAAPVD